MSIRKVYLYLLDGALRLEKNAPAEQFTEDAPDAPDVDGRRVVARAHQYLRCPVVLGDHLLGHVARPVRLLHSRQAKITNLQTSKMFQSVQVAKTKQSRSGCATRALSRQRRRLRSNA